MRGLLLIALAAACGGDDVGRTVICFGCTLDGSIDSGAGICNPLTQIGCQPAEKCTWIIDATTPQYVGHIGCVPDGTAQVGAACEYGAAGATGYDNCYDAVSLGCVRSQTAGLP